VQGELTKMISELQQMCIIITTGSLKCHWFLSKKINSVTLIS